MISNLSTVINFRFDTYQPSSTAVFEELVITANVPKPKLNSSIDAADCVYYPVTSEVSIMPLKTEDYKFTEEQSGDRITFELSLLNKDKEILSFGIWGRVFDRDDGEPTPERDSATASRLNVIVLFVLMLTVIIIQY